MVTCFSTGTDLETKKLRAAFSKSIITTGEISPWVRMGAFALVGSTVTSGVWLVPICQELVVAVWKWLCR